jgi:hypothetical protein
VAKPTPHPVIATPRYTTSTDDRRGGHHDQIADLREIGCRDPDYRFRRFSRRSVRYRKATVQSGKALARAPATPADAWPIATG